MAGVTHTRRSPNRAQRFHQLGDPTIQLEPRVHPLGGDASRWHGMNLGRGAIEELERAAASKNVLFMPPFVPLLPLDLRFLACANFNSLSLSL